MDDLSRSLNDILAGYQGMNQTMSAIQTPGFPQMGAQAGLPTPPPVPQMYTPAPFIATTPPPPIPTYTASPIPPPMMPTGASMQSAWQYGAAQGQQHQMQNATLASAMDPSMNWASPGQMTPSNLALFQQTPVFDPRTAAPSYITGASPPLPLLPMQDLYRTRPPLEFARPFNAAAYQGREIELMKQQDYANRLRGLAGAGAGGAFEFVGTAGGAVIGGLLGGVPGAVAGATVGGLGGMAASVAPIGEVFDGALRPAIERRADAAQLQAASRRWVMGGGELDITGEGLSVRGAQQLTRRLGQVGREANVNRQDLVQLTQLAGEQGLLEGAQDSEAIAKAMKGMLGLVSAMGKVTGDPDFRQNLQRLAQLKQYGFSDAQMNQATENLAYYARMGGQDVDTIMGRYGLRGANVFAGAGLHAYGGFVTGTAAPGFSRNLETSGAIDRYRMQQYGGQEGVSELYMDAMKSLQAGPMKGLVPGLLGAYDTEKGKFMFDKNVVKDFTSGKLSYQDLLNRGGKTMQNSKFQRLIAESPDAMMADLAEQLSAEQQESIMLSLAEGLINDGVADNLKGAFHVMTGDEATADVMARNFSKKSLQQKIQQSEAEIRQRGFAAREAGKKGTPTGGRAARRLKAWGSDVLSKYSWADEAASFLGGLTNDFDEYSAKREELARFGSTGTTMLGRGYGDDEIVSAEALSDAEKALGLNLSGLSPGEAEYSDAMIEQAIKMAARGGEFGKAGAEFVAGPMATLMSLTGFQGRTQDILKREAPAVRMQAEALKRFRADTGRSVNERSLSGPMKEAYDALQGQLNESWLSLKGPLSQQQLAGVFEGRGLSQEQQTTVMQVLLESETPEAKQLAAMIDEVAPGFNLADSQAAISSPNELRKRREKEMGSWNLSSGVAEEADLWDSLEGMSEAEVLALLAIAAKDGGDNAKAEALYKLIPDEKFGMARAAAQKKYNAMSSALKRKLKEKANSTPTTDAKATAGTPAALKVLANAAGQSAQGKARLGQIDASLKGLTSEQLLAKLSGQSPEERANLMDALTREGVSTKGIEKAIRGNNLSALDAEIRNIGASQIEHTLTGVGSQGVEDAKAMRDEYVDQLNRVLKINGNETMKNTDALMYVGAKVELLTKALPSNNVTESPTTPAPTRTNQQPNEPTPKPPG